MNQGEEDDVEELTFGKGSGTTQFQKLFDGLTHNSKGVCLRQNASWNADTKATALLGGGGRV
jgi:hypothetical protein